MNKYGMEIMGKACSVCVAAAILNIRCNAVMLNMTLQRNCLFIPSNEPFATFQ